MGKASQLRSLRLLTVECGMVRITSYLACLHVPSSPYLDPDPIDMFVSHFSLNESLDASSGNGIINLRCLRLEGGIQRKTEIHTTLHQLKHLITFTLNSLDDSDSVDALPIALSPLNQDFSSICPRVKKVELTDVCFSPSAFEH